MLFFTHISFNFEKLKAIMSDVLTF